MIRRLVENKILMSEWNYEKNKELDVNFLKPFSEKKAWWKCKNGHEWEATIHHRSSGHGCPYCSGRRAISGVNDLKTLYPLLAKEFNEEKNGILASDVLPRSGKNFWWKCSICNFEWKATPHNRNNKSLSTGCPNCAKRTQTSFPEQAIFFCIKNNYPDAKNGYKDYFKNGMELDIFIPSLKIGIEYDGEAWHNGKGSYKKEKNKNNICIQNGIRLIRIKENYNGENDTASDYIVIKRHPNNDDIEKAIKELSLIIPLEKDIDLTKEENKIRAMYMQNLKEESLVYKFPNLLDEWNYEKNKELVPTNIFPGSHIKVWWKCKNGHEWQSLVSSRTRGIGCPYCSNKKVLKGYNDLTTTSLLLVKEWNYERNKNITPYDITKSSNKKVWWKCKNGHEWEASPNSRTHGNGCPYCSGRFAIPGINDLYTTNPELAKEWHPIKNNDLMPNQFKSSSGQKIWWKCKNGHEWETAIYHRTNGTGCPYCSGKKVLKGYNDLSTKNPLLAQEWNYEKNKDLKPEMFSKGSHKKVWWKCKNGHEWEAVIKNRTIGRGCPYCKKKPNNQ